jgi:predicted unusual protein kinase regulating ubiquinone biosynthesis (AarF/ABC1/UbiB family)
MADGTVTFLDFGLVKRWNPGEWESLTPSFERMLAGDVHGTVDALILAGFLPADHGLDDQRVFDYVRTPYVPFQPGPFTFDPGFVARTVQTMIDLTGAHADVLRAMNMPPTYVILDRVTLGLAGLLGRLHATADWRAILDEYRIGASPSTELGRQEAAWRASSSTAAR